MIHTDSNNFRYYESLEEIKEDGYTPVQALDVLYFFTLRGRTTMLAKANLIPLECRYVVLGTDNRYYLREYKGYDIDSMFFFKKTLNFGDEDGVERLQRYIYDDKVWILYSPEMIADMKTMLARLCKANVNGTAELKYKLFIQILEASLKLEDYKDYGRSHCGFKTCCKIQEDYISELWKKTIKN